MYTAKNTLQGDALAFLEIAADKIRRITPGNAVDKISLSFLPLRLISSVYSNSK